MTPIERQRIKEVVNGMTEEQREVALECFSLREIATEVCKRDARKSIILQKIKTSMDGLEGGN